MLRLDILFLLAVDLIFLYALLRLDERMTDLERKTGHIRPKDKEKLEKLRQQRIDKLKEKPAHTPRRDK
jgi:hypothetical protein